MWMSGLCILKFEFNPLVLCIKNDIQWLPVIDPMDPTFDNIENP